MLLGDETPIAEKGISLSGGQKQRVGLARAAYRVADIYLLDNPISALDDQTQEHIWTHLIEGLLQHATVIVGSSRPVISCTATVHVTADGLKQGEYTEYHNGWCDKRSKPVPPRYAQGADKAPAEIRIVAEPPAVPAHTSSVRKLSAPTQRSRVGSSLMTVEDASVSDVTNEVKLYEEFAVSASKMSQNQIDAARSIRSVSVELQAASPDSQMQSLTRAIGNRSSFIDQQEESQPEKRSIMRSRRKSSYDSAFGSVRQRSQMDDSQLSKMDNRASHLEVIVEDSRGKPPIQTSAVHVTSATADTPDDYQPSSSDVGFLQWIHACNIGYSYGSLMVISYFLYQVFRSYFSLVASWWKDLLFGLSSINFNWVMAGIVIAQLVFRVSPLSLFLKADFVLLQSFSYVLFQSHVFCSRCHPTTWRTMQEQSAPSACAKLFARL